MSFPATMYVLLKGGQVLTVQNALWQTEEVVLNFDQENYRDSPPVIPAVAAAGGSTGAAIALTGSGVTVTPGSSATTNSVTASVSATASILQDDNYNHAIPRPVFYRRTMIRWWDVANPGTAQTISGELVNGSALVTVESLDGLFVGQGISHASIPANAFIQALTYVMSSSQNGTTVTPTIVMSRAATANVSDAPLVVAAGAGGAANLVGQCWMDRFLGWSASLPKRV